MWYSIIYHTKPRIEESLLLHMKKKEMQKLFFNLFNEMEELEMSCANNNDVSRNTMKVETFDFFLNEYLGLFGETQKSINECTDKKLCAWAEKEFSALSSSMRKLLVDNLFRIVFPYDNFHRFAHTPAELEDVVQAVEDDFSTEVQKAIDYFGEDFLSDKLDNYYKIGM